MKHERKIEYLGVTKNLAQWARQTGIPTGTLRKRLSSGWSVEATLTTPTMHIGGNHKSVVVPKFIAFELVEHHHRQLSDELQRTMRRFMREFARTASAMAVDRGEVANFSKDHPDQSFPIAQDPSELEFFQK